MRCQFNYNFIAYIEATIPRSERMALEQHLLSCLECSETLTYITSAYQKIEDQKTLSVNPFLYTRIKEGLAQKERIHDYRIKRILQPAFIGLILIVALATGFLLGNAYQSSEPSSNNASLYSSYTTQEPLEIAFLNE